ncbi:MAG TPA: PIN domain-containing protein [Candidatus Sulfotelmatobacter sp.]|nr:PIN domain-containing protein [Candidatus Sulfotelmatobacter sp.]
MAIILDTDVIIKGEKGSFDLMGWLAAQTGQELEISAITVAELWHGVERATAAHRAKRELYVRTIVERLPVVPYTEVTALEHARIWATLESSGKMIGFYDIIVAATALERGSAVATFNERHFAQVRGLKVIKPK